MFTLCVKGVFSAAHRLENYQGKCEQLHGHNYLVEALFRGEKLNQDGMLADFSTLKNYLKYALEELDHKYLNDIAFFREKTTSSEHVAMYVFAKLKQCTSAPGVALKEVKVWESESAGATYGE